MSAPNASNSGTRYPAPTPRSRRPLLITSTNAASSASCAADFNAGRTTAVPIRARRVRAAIAAANASGCERYPSSKKWCSESHTESAPRRSASSTSSNQRP